MKAMKKLLALVMVLAMVTVFFAAAPAAYAEGITVSLNGDGGDVTVTVSAGEDLAALEGIRIKIEAPEGFVFQDETHISSLDATINSDSGDVLLDSNDPVDISAGTQLLTVHYAYEGELPGGDYTFTATVTEAYDENFDDFSIRGATASATYSVAAPATPTAEPDGGEVEAGTEVKFSCETEGADIYYSTDGGKTWTQGDSFTVNEAVTIQLKAVKNNVVSDIGTHEYTIKAAPTNPPAEPTPAPTQKPAEPTPAPTQKPTDPKNPTTGDESNLVLYVVIMAATLALGAVTFVVIRKGNRA